MIDELTRPIVGIENRTAQEVFDIMAARIRRSALSPGSTGETEGWVLVPKEPTEAMCSAGREESKNLFEQPICRADAKDIYRAMLAAAGGRDE